MHPTGTLSAGKAELEIDERVVWLDLVFAISSNDDGSSTYTGARIQRHCRAYSRYGFGVDERPFLDVHGADVESEVTDVY